MDWCHRRNGIWIAGLALALLAGCHDRDDKPRGHRERVEPRAERHTRVDVDVAINRPPADTYVEPAPSDVVVEEPPPVFVERSEPEAVIIERHPYLIVREPPPPVIVESRPPPPPGVFIWIDGCWSHDGRHYTWARGHYEHPRHGKHYVAPRWVHRDRGYEFHPGHWQ